MSFDPYKVLGVSPESSEAELRAAWRARCREHPPDTDPAGFEPIRKAWELVRDPAVYAKALLEEPFPEFPPPLRLEQPLPDTATLSRALLRYLIASGRFDLEPKKASPKKK